MSAAEGHPTDALLDLVYGELPAAEGRRVQQHLAGCKQCAATVLGYQSVRQAARALPDAFTEAPGLEALLEAGAESARRARRRRTTLWATSFGTAAAAAALLVVAVRPSATPEAVAALPSAAPSTLGPLARADVPAPSATLQEELRAPAARSEGARANASLGGAAAKSMPTAKKESAERQVATEPARPAAPTVAQASAAAPAAVASGSDKRAVGFGAASAGALGAPAAAEGAKGAASWASSNRAADSASLAKTQPDAGTAMAQARAMARRQQLLALLKDARHAEALSLLAELCPLDMGLFARRQYCLQVLRDYPGTAEAAAAQRVLDASAAP